MNRIRNLISALLGLLALAGLAAGLSWLFGSQGVRPGQQVSPVRTVQHISPVQTPTPAILPTLTPYVPETLPPVPTPLPTPLVTPIPVATPPFIPGLEDAVPEPFHIILREGNAVWMVNGDGSDRRLLIDTEAAAGLYMRYIPWEGAESYGRWSVSPDGSHLALTVHDVEKPERKGQRIRSSIYLLDLATGEFRFLVEGATPVWSPKGTQIAYVNETGLWIVDTKTGEGREIFAVAEEYMVRDFSWSPDGHRIAFLHQEASLGGIPEMLVIEAEGNEEVVQLIPSTVWPFRGTAWSSDGKNILHVFPTKEPTGQHFDNLWTVDIETRTSVPLTTQAIVSSFALSPSDGDWIAFAGKFPYEAQPSPLNDLWLLRGDGSSLLRLTRDSNSDRRPQWSPDGARIVFRREDEGLWALNLIDGTLRQIFSSPVDFVTVK